MLLDYIYARSKEASTWRAIIMGVCGLTGLHLSPDTATSIISIGVSVSALIGALFPDKFNDNKGK